MAKKITKKIKVQSMGGSANPGPPLGPVLGQAGINIQEFISRFNEMTAEHRGIVVPAVITVYEDRSFDLLIKTPPASVLIKKMLNLPKGSAEPGKNKVGTITKKQLEEIAKIKMPDLNANNLEAAMKTIAGTARQMGVKVEG